MTQTADGEKTLYEYMWGDRGRHVNKQLSGNLCLILHLYRLD